MSRTRHDVEDSQPVDFVCELERDTPLRGSFDVIVCGAGPAGICAALAAAREGCRTLLVEAQGCLGGVWTSGLLSLILDAGGKGGIIKEIQERLAQRNAISRDWLYDAEEMKYLLEEMVEEAGVEWLLHTRVSAALVEDGAIKSIIIENKTGRSAYAAKVFVDATGEGDLACLAGCGFEYGDPESQVGQPMTLMAIVNGVPAEAETDSGGMATFLPKEVFRSILLNAGHQPSYSQPSLFRLPGGLFCLMIHHGYEYCGLDAGDVTQATHEGRAEVMRATGKLRENVPGWESLRVVVTANHVGVREGRRIRGLYQLTRNDIEEGRRFADAVCHVSFPVDVHSLKKADGGGYGNTGIMSQPYDIPYRALVAADIHGLLLAGRCISGDFHAHASYRVTGNACVTGEAAGRSAAFCVSHDAFPHQIKWTDYRPCVLKFEEFESLLIRRTM